MQYGFGNLGDVVTSKVTTHPRVINLRSVYDNQDGANQFVSQLMVLYGFAYGQRKRKYGVIYVLAPWPAQLVESTPKFKAQNSGMRRLTFEILEL